MEASNLEYCNGVLQWQAPLLPTHCHIEMVFAWLLAQELRLPIC